MWTKRAQRGELLQLLHLLPSSALTYHTAGGVGGSPQGSHGEDRRSGGGLTDSAKIVGVSVKDLLRRKK